MTAARKHHYIPQCYLKGFARHRNNPKLFVVDGRTKKAFSTIPANVAAVRDFHTIDVEGLPPDALENNLSKFEGDLSPALERIIAARSIQDETDRAYLFNLVGLIAVKNPRRRENFRGFQERVLKMVMDLATATPERWESQVRQAKAAGFLDENTPVNYEQMRDFVVRDQFTINMPPGSHVGLELNSVDTVLPLIFGRKWALLRAPPKTTGFVTSDHPVCLMQADPQQRGNGLPFGYGTPRTQIVFPISNELAMLGAFEIAEDEMDADELFIAQVNGSIILHADRQIYARDGEFPYIFNHNKKVMRGVDLVNDTCLTKRNS
jgi:Protein of unknown function (DUF4238)